jgi:signal peptidase I
VAATAFFTSDPGTHIAEASDSMNPTLHAGDDLTVVSVPEVHRGDVIVFDPMDWPHPEEFKGALFVKRVVGVGGDLIMSTSAELKVNGKVVVEDYALKDVDQFRFDNYTAAVPPGQVFVVGDWRSNSVDSRVYGDRGGISPKNIVGVVVAVNGKAITPTKAFTNAGLPGEPASSPSSRPLIVVALGLAVFVAGLIWLVLALSRRRVVPAVPVEEPVVWRVD